MIKNLARRALHRAVWSRRSARPIWADDWDVCLVFDGCRADLWREVAPGIEWLPDAAADAWSVAACSPTWYGKTFAPTILPDERIGVVSSNPFAAAEASERPLVSTGAPVDRHQQVMVTDYVFQDSWGCEVSGGELDVTAPETVIDRAWQVWKGHELDRLVVHLMQPHAPFRSRPEWFPEPPADRAEGVDGYAHPDLRPIWERIRDGDVSATIDNLWTAYRDNLHWALDAVEPLVDAVEGEFLLTADHGQAVGEWGVWGHPPGRATPQLRRVPWVTVAGNASADYEPQRERDGETDAAREKQLRALGYR